MIRLIEAKNYRCLKYVKRSMTDFQVLVGPNASGKTTFLDVVAFLGDLVSEGPEKAIEERTMNFQDLLWGRSGDKFELAMELDIPEEIMKKARFKNHSIVRYEVSIGNGKEIGDHAILAEQVLLKEPEQSAQYIQKEMFPEEQPSPETIIGSKGQKVHTVVRKSPGRNDNYYPDGHAEKATRWAPAFKLGPYRSALGNLPADELRFPISSWLKEVLTEGIQRIVLNSELMRKPSPPGRTHGFRPDGSNLPWVIELLRSSNEENYQNWIEHIRTALPDIEEIKIIDRPEDRHRYLVVRYKDNLEVPSWMVSDGTLRLLALTLPAYLSASQGIYLIEEPENGIHPRAVETVYQSLTSVYDAQILIATHSPIILSGAEPENILCFSKTESGATDIVSGVEHPALREWLDDRKTNIGVLFAGGVLE